jgi:hypothetical protein
MERMGRPSPNVSPVAERHNLEVEDLGQEGGVVLDAFLAGVDDNRST